MSEQPFPSKHRHPSELVGNILHLVVKECQVFSICCVCIVILNLNDSHVFPIVVPVPLETHGAQ